MEIWKDIEGYEGLYQVSNQGRVKRLKGAFNEKYPEKILKASIYDAGGGLSVTLRDRQGRSRSKSLAKIVLTTFKGKPPRLARNTIHIDGNLENNKLENLKWNVTKAYYKPKNEQARNLFDKDGKKIVYNYLRSSKKSQLVNFGFCDIDDLAQECLLKIWNAIDSYDLKYSFATFCYKVCDFIFKTFYRKNALKRAKYVNFTDIIDSDYENLDRILTLSND